MKRNSESGVALLSAILVLMLMSAMLVGFIALINADQNASGVNRDQTQSYAAAHAGVEKLTSDLGQLFETNFSPTGAQVNALVAASRQPNLGNGTSYTAPGGGAGYGIEFNDGPPFTAVADGNPDPEDAVNGSQITDGVYAGLMGIITPYRMVVTARTIGGSEVRMRRTMQTVAIPVFQFGIFSDNDLSFFAGPNFNFGGRVHTNQNLYLAQGGANAAAATLVLSDRVTAVGDVVREYLSNGEDLGTARNGGSVYNGTVRVAKASNCPSIAANCRDLLPTEDSVDLLAAPPLPPSVLTWNPGIAPAPGRWEMVRRLPNRVNANWDGISRAQYNSWIRNGETGARRLDLPIVDVSAGTTPIDLIRRARPNEPSGPGTSFQERFFRLASLRILISDTAADFNNIPTMTAGAPVDLSALVPGAGGYSATGAPTGTSDGSAGTLLATNTPTLRGFIKIERQRPDGTTWDDVTMNILNLGIAGRNISTGVLNTPDTHMTQQNGAAATNVCTVEPYPDAVIRLQRIRDVPQRGAPCGIQAAAGNGQGPGPSLEPRDYWPTVLYDAREATRRENDNPATLYAAGVMHYVELDVNNLRKWFNSATGGAGNTMNTTGYVVYFSDRRNNKNALNAETGELGYEDIVNPASATSASNTVLDTGEDFNGNGVLDTYGNTPRLVMNAPLNAAATLRTGLTVAQARMNPAAFFRRGLKLVNGGIQGGVSQLPAVGAQGLTVASENPVYVQGNYNACGTMEQSCVGTAPNYVDGYGVHVSAAILADSVTLLSRNWNDIRSFTSPHAPGGREALETWYRVGVISGKGISFPRPASAPTVDPKDFGTDGGAHNFMRFLEDWGGIRLNYRGSLISLYTSRQGIGVYKCCNIVYGAPTRGYNFDVEFLTPNLLPPRTPMFRDVNTLTFRQVLRPTQ